MAADFDQLLERIRGGEVDVLNLESQHMNSDRVRALSMALMNENNEVISLDLSRNNFWS